ncbi:hypothetical protein [Nonomuraea sp. NPDC003709]|uniref:hypothetical protein n=1 Tax=Nonomuraea sp. NPDC003709 TaxID=3154450 RepID=UPI0033A8129F
MSESVIPGLETSLWEEFLSPANLGRALRRVEANRGAPGVDGMSTEELRLWGRERWAGVREALDAGTYRPVPVRRVVILKPAGGERLLGVPAVLDRLIQQAIAQVLTPIFAPSFSSSLFGFRPGSPPIRRCGPRGESSTTACDRSWTSILNGSSTGSTSTSLWRGHRFVRYADDLWVFVRSERAARRVLDSVTTVVEQRLKLKVNREKSSVRHASQATLLGFWFYFTRSGVKIRVDSKAASRLKDRIRKCGLTPISPITWTAAIGPILGMLGMSSRARRKGTIISLTCASSLASL